MYSPDNSRHFKPVVEPSSGVVSWQMSTRIAFHRQGFYFVNASMTDDGRYLYFHCYEPPAVWGCLGQIDFETDEVRMFPETQFMAASPLIDTVTGEMFWANRFGIFRRGPGPEDPVRRICGVPAELNPAETDFCFRTVPESYATHLTFTPAKKGLFLDLRIRDRFVQGVLNIADGRYDIWTDEGVGFNHGQHNPHRPGLALVAKDFWEELATGERHGIPFSADGVFERMWLVKSDGTRKLLPPAEGMRATHEFWSADGKKVYYCFYPRRDSDPPRVGVARYNIDTDQSEIVADVSSSHAYCTADERFLVYDRHLAGYRGCPCRVAFFDTATRKETVLCAQMGPLNTPEDPSIYHPDPHPRFVARDNWIVYTGSEPDRAMTLALVKTADLIR